MENRIRALEAKVEEMAKVISRIELERADDAFAKRFLALSTGADEFGECEMSLENLAAMLSISQDEVATIVEYSEVRVYDGERYINLTYLNEVLANLSTPNAETLKRHLSRHDGRLSA